MKTKVEIAGYEIEIEEKDGLIIVKAEKDEEIVEEFTIETGEFDGDGQGQDDDEVQGFGEFGGDSDEEEDFEGGEEFEDEDGDDEPKLESFQSFVNKNK